MPFDTVKWNKSAVQGDVASAVIETVGLSIRIEAALRKLSEVTGLDLSEDLSEIRKQRVRLDALFNDLTGYTEK